MHALWNEQERSVISTEMQKQILVLFSHSLTALWAFD
jgi:hypothetical protein